MSTITPGVQTLNSAFPFTVALESQYQSSLLPVLYIVGSTSTKKNLKEANIIIKPKTSEQFKLGGFNFTFPDSPADAIASVPSVAPSNVAPSNVATSPGPSMFNLAIAFRAGVLEDSLIPQLTQTIYNALSNAIPSDNSCIVNGPLVRTSDNALVWYCAIENDLFIPEGLVLELKDIYASASVGSRNTQVEFTLGHVYFNDNPNPLSFTRSIHVDIINHQGIAPAPLYFTVLGQNTLLNNSSAQDLSIYFETTDRRPVKFGENTTFVFEFPFGDTIELVTLGGQSAINGIVWDSESPVKPYNSTNKSLPNASTPLPNFKGQYNNNPTDSSITPPPPGTKQLSQTFAQVEGLTIPNPAYVALQNVVTQYQDNATTSKNFYTGASGPVGIIEGIIHTKSQAAGTTRGFPNGFIPTFHAIGGKYIDTLCNIQIAVQAYLETLSYFFVSKFIGTQGFFLSSETPITTGTWDTSFTSLYQNYISGPDASSSFPADSYLKSIAAHTDNNNFFESSSDPTNSPDRWENTAFSNFFNHQFTNILYQLSTLNGELLPTPPTFDPGTNYIMPSRALYDFCYDIFVAYQAYIVSNYASKLLLDSSGGFDKNQWDTAYTSLKGQISSTQFESITDQAPTVTSEFKEQDLWDDNVLVEYVKTNWQTLLNGTFLYSSYVIPSASLYDYLYISYKASITNSALTTLTPTDPFYIDPVSCIFKFSNLQLSGANGLVMINVKVQNLPGYWDTNFQVPVIKVPSKLTENLDIRDGYISVGNEIPTPGTPPPTPPLPGTITAASDITSKGNINDQYGPLIPTGTVLAFYGSAAPAGWLLCDGSSLDQSTYSALSDLLTGGTSAPVNLPDLRGRTIIGVGPSGNTVQSDGTKPDFAEDNDWTLGYTGGEYQHTLSEEEMPSHQHFGWGASADPDDASSDYNWGINLGSPNIGRSNFNGYYGSAANADGGVGYLYGSTFAGGTSTGTIETTNSSIAYATQCGNEAHNNMTPYLALAYIIKC